MKLENKNKEIDFDLFSELLIYSAEYATKWNYIAYFENYIICKRKRIHTHNLKFRHENYQYLWKF